ncbi:uncharacterized protein LOC141591528 [Silene latifolia]|uniref:uncharacterized protein LOC141591528 n=1 Tax=Silene latifolia TaxID=37657 RepID=UPI003D788850
MATTTTTSTIPLPNLVNINKPKHIVSCYYQIKIPRNHTFQPLISPITLSKQNLSYPFQNPLQKHTHFRVSAVTDTTTTTTTEDVASEIVSATSNGDDGVSTIISALLFIAFVALSILTIGVVYIGVTDFLQKREKDRFEKEEEAKKKKKSGKKKVGVRARGGPRGFGQKIDDDFDFED